MAHATDIDFNPYLPSAAGTDLDALGARPGAAASREERLGSWLLDWTAAGLLAAIGLTGQAFAPSFGSIGAVLGWLPAAAFGGLTVVLLHRHGQTVGDWVRGCRVVRNDGTRAGLVRLTLIRLAMPIACYLGPALIDPRLGAVGVAAFLVDALCLFGPESRCLHDWAADTKVVYV